MLYLLVEEKYRSFSWCQRCLAGIWEEMRKKRTSILEIDAIKHVYINSEISAVLLVGASEKWVHKQACLAHNAGLHPIVLSNRMPAPIGFSVSSVTMDIHDSMGQAVDYLHSLGCARLALYGCNPSATSDPWREDVFRSLLGQDARVFYNTYSLDQTFSEFWTEHRCFDGVICANDYAALSLVRHLRQLGVSIPEELRVIGYGDLFLSRLTTPSITSVSDDYEHFGRAALSIYNMLVREQVISAVSILLHSHLQIRATTGHLPYHPGCIDWDEPAAAKNPFYADAEITEMATLETLLQQCDAIDLDVIRHLLSGMSYASIAEACFISETAVKYRVRKMESVSGAEDRVSLAAFLKKYF